MLAGEKLSKVIEARVNFIGIRSSFSLSQIRLSMLRKSRGGTISPPCP
jgi:hypothetical protein